MAILVLGGGTNPRSSVNGMTVTVGAQGQSVGFTPTNNRRRPSPTFTPLDQLIMHLDALFDMLPDPTPWATYAANIAGDWQLCANCQPDASAKKLFRQYNFNRTLLGLGTVVAPIDDTEFADAEPTTSNTGPGGPAYGSVVITGPAVPPAGIFLIGQAGQALSNPILDCSMVAPYSLYGSGPVFDWFATMSNGINMVPGNNYNLAWCQCTANGAPGNKGSWQLDCIL